MGLDEQFKLLSIDNHLAEVENWLQETHNEIRPMRVEIRAACDWQFIFGALQTVFLACIVWRVW